MNQFSVKMTSFEKRRMLNICDADMLGRKIVQDELNIHISKSYYGQKLVETKEAKEMLMQSSIINMVGREAVSLAIELGIGSKDGVKTISDVPFLIVFKI